MTLKTSRKRVTTTDIARAVGVSRATVGFVLNDTPGQKISEGTRKRVLAEAERLGYRPHRAAQALASGQSRIVLLLLPDWPIEHSMSTHLDEASHVLDEAGFSLLTWTPREDGRAKPLWETLQPDVVLGMVPLTDEQTDAITQAGARTLSPETVAPLGHSDGPVLQIEHLAARGHRRIVFAAPSDRRLQDLADERYERARKAAVERGIELRREIVDESIVREEVRGWINEGFDAVAAYNDELAALVVTTSLRLGHRVPDEISVIGHDDAPICRLTLPSLSTVHVDTAGLGRYVAELALHLAAGAEIPSVGPTFTATLMPRESTAGYVTNPSQGSDRECLRSPELPSGLG